MNKFLDKLSSARVISHCPGYQPHSVAREAMFLSHSKQHLSTPHWGLRFIEAYKCAIENSLARRIEIENEKKIVGFM